MSGYGIFANVKASYSDVENVVVTAQYKFGKSSKIVTLDEVSAGSFKFPVNAVSSQKNRIVYIPVETPDGKYTLTFTITATDAAGNTITDTTTRTLVVKGNMYEDDFTGDS